MIIYDKASWHLDSGVSSEIVVEHFNIVFSWLNDKKMLSDNGKEMLQVGIDSSISLNDNMVTDEGAKFLAQYYDELIKKSKYDISKEIDILNHLYDNKI